MVSILKHLGFLLILGPSTALITNDIIKAQLHKYHYRDNIFLLRHFLKTLKIQKEVVDVCLDFYKTFWSARTGYGDRLDYQQLLPSCMYQRLLLDICWTPLKHSQLFTNCSIPLSRHISALMEQSFRIEGEVIYLKNHVKKKMIYISSGIIQVISEQDGETPIMSFTCGTLMGESSLFYSYKSKNTVRCKTYCEVFELHKSKFIKAMAQYPDQYKELRKIITERYNYAKNLANLTNHFMDTSQDKNLNITWIKNTLHKLMSQDKEKREQHEYQNVYLRYEMHEHKVYNKMFCARYLNMLAIAERVELETDGIFLRPTFPYVFLPESVFQDVWSYFVFGNVVIAVFIIPYHCFIDTPVSLFASIAFYVISVVWILDFLVAMCTAVKTKDEVIKTITGIVEYKLNSLPFIADFLACIPLQLFSAIIVPKADNVTHGWLQINKLLKVYHIFKFFNYCEEGLSSSIIKVHIIKYFFCITYLVFLTGFLLYGYNCTFYGHCDYHADAYSVYFTSLQIITGIGLISVWDMDNYFNFLYWFMMIIGFMACFTMAVNLIADFCLQYMPYQRVQLLALDFNRIVASGQLTPADGNRIMAYLNAQWQLNYAAKILTLDTYIADMPVHLRRVLREAAFADVIRKTAFFMGVDENIITDICACLTLTILPPDEVVCYYGDTCTHVYILIDGFCYIGGRSKIISKGYIISMLESYYGLFILKSVVCKTFCKFLTIETADLYKIYSKHSDFEEEMNRLLYNTLDIREESWKVTDDSDDLQTYRSKSMVFNSFFVFPRNMEPNSFMEYEYYIPFDRSVFFGWTKALLMKRTVVPYGQFIYGWEISRAVFAVLSAILFTLPTTNSCSYTECAAWYLLRILDLAAIIDMYIRLHVCYFNEIGILVVHPCCTAKYYLTHGFLIDLIAVFPLFLVIGTQTPEKVKYLIYFQTSRLLQMHRYLQLIKSIYYNSLLPNVKLYVLGYFPVFVVMTCSIGSVMMNMGCSFHRTLGPTDHYSRGVICKNESWLTKSAFTRPLDPALVQWYGIYAATSIFTLIGMQGFQIQHMHTGYVISIASIAGLFFITFVTANIISFYSITSPFKMTYREAMDNLKHFLVRERIPLSLQNSIIMHYDVKWSRERGRSLTSLISEFHLPLRQDLLFAQFHKVIIEEMDIQGEMTNFFKNIVHEGHHSTVVKSGQVISINDINPYVYIVYNGVVDIVDNDFNVLATLSTGSIFGNLKGTAYSRERVSVIARSHVEVLAFKSTTFMSFIREYKILSHSFNTKLAEHLFFIPGKPIEVLGTEESLEGSAFSPYSRWVKVVEFLAMFISSFLALGAETYQIALKNVCKNFLIFQYVADAVFLLYIIVKYHMAYENEQGYQVRNMAKVRRYHINRSKYRWRFYVDIASCLPLDVIVLISNASNQMVQIFRLNRLTRILNVIDYFTNKKLILSTNHVVNEFIFVLVWSTMFLHVGACIIIYFCCLIPHSMIPEIKCKDNVTHRQRLSVYFNYFYLTVNMFNKAAQNIYIPDTWQLACLLTILMLITSLATILCLSQMFSLVATSYYIKTQYTERWNYLKNLMIREEVSIVIVEKVYSYIQRLWIRNRGVTYPKLLKDAPNYLRESICMTAYGDLIAAHPIFKHANLDFQRQIVTKLDYNIYFPGDYVTFQDDLNEITYFIQQGEISAVPDETSSDSLQITSYEQGQVFCILAGISAKKLNKYTYKATAISILISLRYSDWSYLLEYFPSVEEEIKEYLKNHDI